MKKLTEGAELEEFAHDAGIVTLRPRVVYQAETEEEVVGAMREAVAAGVPITPRGGGTGIPSQSVGAGAILVQSRSRAEVRGGEVICEPGMVKADLNDSLARSGRWMPVDPSSYASCTVGGMVANNSSGSRTLKYGSTVDYVTGLRVATVGGGIDALVPVKAEDALSLGGRAARAASLIVENLSLIAGERPKVTKNSSGYRLEKVVHDGLFDLPRLFVGAEGTLGIVTQAAFATVQRPKWRLLLIAESSLDELGSVADAFRELSPSALELVDKSVFRATGRWGRVSRYSRSEDPYLILCELDGELGGPGERAEEVAGSTAGRLDPMVVSGQKEISEAWEARNETLTMAQGIRRGSKVLVPGVEDLVVPPSRLGGLVKLLIEEFGKRGYEYVLYGHAGDANLHARPLMDPTGAAGGKALDELMEDCFERVWRMGGSMSGEHGDGMLRAKYLERQYPRTHSIMRELRGLYDPKGVLNPGVKVV